MRRDSTSENTRAQITTRDIDLVNSDVSPERNIHGAKKIMVVKTAKITGLITMVVPLNAASKPSSPSSVLLWIASPTMIASSTITPITRRKAKVDNMLKETLKNGSMARPPANAVAMPMETQMATVGRRNKNSVIKTRIRPVKKFEPIVAMRLRYMSDKSFHSVMDMPSGKAS